MLVIIIKGDKERLINHTGTLFGLVGLFPLRGGGWQVFTCHMLQITVISTQVWTINQNKIDLHRLGERKGTRVYIVTFTFANLFIWWELEHVFCKNGIKEDLE